MCRFQANNRTFCLIKSYSSYLLSWMDIQLNPWLRNPDLAEDFRVYEGALTFPRSDDTQLKKGNVAKCKLRVILPFDFVCFLRVMDYIFDCFLFLVSSFPFIFFLLVLCSTDFISYHQSSYMLVGFSLFFHAMGKCLSVCLFVCLLN